MAGCGARTLWATIGRFRCRNSSCPRKIFCERLPGIARAYGRQTERASEIVRLIGYVAGGLPGQRLLARLSIATSEDTVLRRVREQPTESIGRVRFTIWASMIGLGERGNASYSDLYNAVHRLPNCCAGLITDEGTPRPPARSALIRLPCPTGAEQPLEEPLSLADDEIIATPSP